MTLASRPFPAKFPLSDRATHKDTQDTSLNNPIHTFQKKLVAAAFFAKHRNTLLTEHLKQLQQSQWLSPEALASLQWERLKQTLENAYAHVPYYRDSMNAAGLTPQDFNQPADLTALPVLERETLREKLTDMAADNIDPIHRVLTATGGSTGVPTPFFHTRDYIQKYQAVSLRCFEWANWTPGDGWARIWGADVDIGAATQWKTRLINSLTRRLVIPAWELSESTMHTYARQLQIFQPRVIEGYATPLHLFAQFLIENNVSGITPDFVISSAETLFPHQREDMQSAFCCPVLNRYGTREVGAIAHECPQGSMHIQAEHVFVEYVNEDNTPVKPGEPGEILVTTLTNEIMPLIRYRIGDVGAHALQTCDCGRGLPLMQDLSGRVQDLIVLPDGRYLPGEFFPHLLKDFDIKAFQVVQDTVDHLSISVVPGPALSTANKTRLLDIVKQHLHQDVTVELKPVDEIPLTKTGKLRYTISHVSRTPQTQNDIGTTE
ncbi:MAG: phenylacetate-CoA ligase [Kiritimatiellia bacterium]|jgi:phenylacetate-CoA ligase